MSNHEILVKIEQIRNDFRDAPNKSPEEKEVAKEKMNEAMDELRNMEAYDKEFYKTFLHDAANQAMDKKAMNEKYMSEDIQRKEIMLIMLDINIILGKLTDAKDLPIREKRFKLIKDAFNNKKDSCLLI